MQDPNPAPTPQQVTDEVETNPISDTIYTKEQAMYALTHSFAESELGLFWECNGGEPLDWTGDIMTQIANSTDGEDDQFDHIDLHWIKLMCQTLPQVIKLMSDNHLMSNQDVLYMTIGILRRLLTFTPLTPVAPIHGDPDDAHGWESLSRFGDEDNLQNQRCSRIFYNKCTGEYYDVELGKWHIVEYDVSFSGSSLLSVKATNLFRPALLQLPQERDFFERVCKDKVIAMPYYPARPDDQNNFAELTISDLAMADVLNMVAELLTDSFPPEDEPMIDHDPDSFFQVTTVQPEVYYIASHNRFILMLNLYSITGQLIQVHYVPDQTLYVPSEISVQEQNAIIEGCAINLRKTMDEVIVPKFFRQRDVAFGRNLWIVTLEDYNCWLLPYTIFTTNASTYGVNVNRLNQSYQHIYYDPDSLRIQPTLIQVVPADITGVSTETVIGQYLANWNEVLPYRPLAQESTPPEDFEEGERDFDEIDSGDTEETCEE